LICKKRWDGATNDVGAPENRINVLTPRDNDIFPVFGPVVTAHPYSKASKNCMLQVANCKLKDFELKLFHPLTSEDKP
jgi:hypothetical protein